MKLNTHVHLPQGEGFVPSEKGRYQFFYPNNRYCSDQMFTMAKYDVTLVPVPSNTRCLKASGELVPFLVSKQFALDHLMEYRIIWLEKDTCKM